MKRFAPFAVLLVAACNAPSPQGVVVAADTAATPTLTFAADWSVAQSGPVLSGDKATIHYDVARLPNCRATYHGLPAWGISAYYAVDGGQAFNGAGDAVLRTVPSSASMRPSMFRPAAISPSGSATPTSTAASSGTRITGSNFHFALVADAPALHFRWPSWTDRAIGAARRRARLPRRLRHSSSAQLPPGLQRHADLGRHRAIPLDGGAVQSASLTSTPNDYYARASPAALVRARGRSDGGAVVREPRSHRLSERGTRPTARTIISRSNGDKMRARGGPVTAQTRRPDHQPRRFHHRAGGARPPAGGSGASPPRSAGQRRRREHSSWRWPIRRTSSPSTR